jgi:hypothetical protein
MTPNIANPTSAAPVVQTFHLFCMNTPSLQGGAMTTPYRRVSCCVGQRVHEMFAHERGRQFDLSQIYKK